jgi:hypothetical protein
LRIQFLYNWIVSKLFKKRRRCVLLSYWKWVLTGMEPPTGVLPHRPRTRYETWETNPNVEIFTANIKTYKSQKSTHLYSFQEDNWAKHNWTKTGGAVGNTLGNLGNILGGEFIDNVMGTYWELDENNPKKKIQHHPTAPKKKKTWTPWLHSRVISLATKKLYA